MEVSKLVIHEKKRGELGDRDGGMADNARR